MEKIFFKDRICLNCKCKFNRGRLKSGRIEAVEDFRVRKFCSYKCSSIYHQGENHPLYKSEGSIRKDGYIRIALKGERNYLHRHLMEKKIGRRLKSYEHIHHINGDPTDNRLENLLLISNSQHRKNHVETQTRDICGRFKN